MTSCLSVGSVDLLISGIVMGGRADVDILAKGGIKERGLYAM